MTRPDLDARLRRGLDELAGDGRPDGDLWARTGHRLETHRRRRSLRRASAVAVAVVLVTAVAAAVVQKPVPRRPVATTSGPPDAPSGGSVRALPPEAGDRPDPGARYPRRPGAGLFDVERAVGEPARLLGALPGETGAPAAVSVTVRSARRVPAAEVPEGLGGGGPPPPSAAPVVAPGSGPYLAVDVESSSWPVYCTATALVDGAVATPRSTPELPTLEVVRAGSALPTDLPRIPPGSVVTLWFPTGGRAGPFDVACRPSSAALSFLDPREVRGVWRVHT